MNIDTTDLPSYITGYDDYCELKENYGECLEEDVDTIVDEIILEELEAKINEIATGTTNIEKKESD